MRGSFSEIVALAKDRSVAGRRRLATRFGQAFFSHSSDFSSEERTIALDIMMTLLRDAELEIRRDLSELLAREPSAPKRIVMALANDTIEVARPILLGSPMLDESDLLQITAEKGMAHRVAIANRTSLPEAVTKALASAREPEVSSALLQNIALHLPEQVIETLAHQAADRFDLAELLADRAEITSELATHLYWSVSNELRKHMRQRFDLAAPVLEQALEKTVARLTQRDADPSSRRTLADRLLKSNIISPSWIIELVRCKSGNLLREILGGLTKLAPNAVDVLLQPQGTEALALAARALEFSKTEAGSLIMTLRGWGGPNAISPGEMAEAMATFGRLTVGDAKTVLWQWQADPSYLLGLNTRRTN